MTRLSTEQILQDRKNGNAESITNLVLDHKALFDVSCLADFKNLERLDLSFNNLSSLEGLRQCVKLKWLSVSQNKLVTLKGIEGLSKLTVLNAGKNKLRSMDEVGSLISLRALILNDNEIVSICKLDQLKELNTLVLSRNPIPKIGDCLIKVKTLTKLSLSNCQLESIGPSLVSCAELKEVRLAHNDIKILPAELAHNKKIQNLDLGNNLISSWSTLKVLSLLTNLKNLNLQGNPLAEKDKLVKKIKKLLPNLQIFNSKPIDIYTKEERDRVDSSRIFAKELKGLDEESREGIQKNKKPKQNARGQSKDGNLFDSKVHEPKSDPKQNKRKTKYEQAVDEKDMTIVAKDSKRKPKKVKQSEIEVIDDGEIPFADLVAADLAVDPIHYGDDEKDHNGLVNSTGGIVTHSEKNKKSKKRAKGPKLEPLPAPAEIGLGGRSTWGDE
ncbi:Leucine-rich repeat [Dillenia turbinata]|uniref:Leucine-rich repeat n=1 Tax=Dillenia turbinata TaxID=194707 RepID=A0AAN8VJK3_9MAGN